MKSAFVPAIIAALCAILVISTVVQAVRPVFERIGASLTIHAPEDAAGKPVSQR